MAPTRRRALHGVAGAFAALAGCGYSAPDDTPDGERNGIERPENVAFDPPTSVLRRSDSRESLVDVPDETDQGVRETERPAREAVRRGFVTNADAASLLRIDDVEGADAAEQLLAETDYDSEFVYVDRGGVEQCFELSLCYVTWDAYRLRTTYARRYREYDVACSTDARDRVARFFRLQGSVDAEQIESDGMAVHTRGCPEPRWRRDDPETTTPTHERTNTTSARLGRWS